MRSNKSFPTIMAMEWDDFLGWFKKATESAWAELTPMTIPEYYKKHRVLGPIWQKDTRWLGGLSDEEITAVQQKHALAFPPDYRQFLAKLGAPDRPMAAPSWQDGELGQVERPSFYNWLTDDEAITAALRWPLEGLLLDVEHDDLWLDSWGTKPDDDSETAEHLTQRLANAPTLIPLYGHRYLLDYPINGENPVLSIYQADIILYGTNLKTYLIRELASLLNIFVEDTISKLVDEYYKKHIAAIPFWGEIMLNEEGDS